MITVYCYSKCTTCKRALSWLNENHIEYNLIDIKENNPSYDLLKRYHSLSSYPLKKFFNTSGLLYKEYGLSKKIPTMSDEEMYQILSSDGMLVKRPLLIKDEKEVLLGFKEEEWEKVLLK